MKYNKNKLIFHIDLLSRMQICQNSYYNTKLTLKYT